jgi:hypothetical protein
MAKTEHNTNITNLRDRLGIVCQHVARTDEPVVVRRYKREDVAIAPLWDWRFFKRLEAAIRDGRLKWNDALADIMNPARLGLHRCRTADSCVTPVGGWPARGNHENVETHRWTNGFGYEWRSRSLRQPGNGSIAVGGSGPIRARCTTGQRNGEIAAKAKLLRSRPHRQGNHKRKPRGGEFAVMTTAGI